jgi:ceramide glucosyltransferase
MRALSAITVLLAVPALTSVIYFWIAQSKLLQWLDEGVSDEGNDAEFPPVTFLRPLKPGVPNLLAKLVTLVRAMRPGDQILIGAEAGSAELAIAEALRGSYSEVEITVVSCGPGGMRNPKIAKLIAMEPLARHEHWILCDSEAVTDVAFLAAFRREWLQCDVLTAGYRFSNIATWPQRLDAAAVLLALWPGLAMLRSFGRVRLTLGACTAVRRADVQAVGGWSAFAEDLAEDNRLGQVLAEAGRNIQLSAQVVTLESDALSWREYWRHQRRVAVTYRSANSAGFAGAFLSQGVTTSLVLACLRPTEVWAWALFVGVFVIRCLTAGHAAKVLGISISQFASVMLLSSLVETLCWVLSWAARRVWWGGLRRRISWRGKLLTAETR